jgi:hypothetical protein
MRAKNEIAVGLVKNVQYWRTRSEQTRASAAKMPDAKSREAILRVANLYERMAERAERMAQQKGQAILSNPLRRMNRSLSALRIHLR